MLPPDLRRRLEATLWARNVEAADVWTEFRDWLILHQVQPPESLPVEERRQRSAPRFTEPG
jgi:hypothetical protein